MAVLFITHKFPPSIGGMQQQSYALINGMRAKTKVYTLIQQPGENKLAFLLSIKGRVKRMLKEHPDINIVHCNDGTVAAFCTWLTKYTDIKVTATIHGLDITFPNYFFQKWIVPKLLSFDRIFAVSQATADVCVGKGFDNSRVVVVKNGVDIDSNEVEVSSSFKNKMKRDFGIDLDGDKILLSVGRPTRRKGFSWFATRVLPSLRRGYKYVVAGPGNTSKLMMLARNLLPLTWTRQIELAIGYATDATSLRNIKIKNFIYLDLLPYSELIQLIRSAHLMIMPNIKVKGDMEGFGLVALEASLHSTYVLASRLEGITSAIEDGQNGTLLPSENAQAWVTAINNINEKQVTVKAEYAKTYTKKHFSWDKMVDQYAMEFKRMTEDINVENRYRNIVFSTSSAVRPYS